MWKEGGLSAKGGVYCGREEFSAEGRSSVQKGGVECGRKELSGEGRS